MTKIQIFLTGAASIFDIDARESRDSILQLHNRLVDPETERMRIRDSSPEAAFAAVGNSLRFATEKYANAHPQAKTESRVLE
jgi:hypothetical protein